ncbi:hypothetical protein M885DRAFT_621089 [Pelagophyceae sp. CCMP2097]|nr:hypothetical protein M885DRAFT_621089 [Pelagophyceae sp. CCMP2097]
MLEGLTPVSPPTADFFESRLASLERELIEVSKELSSTCVSADEYDVSERAFERAKALRRELKFVIHECAQLDVASTKLQEREAIEKQIKSTEQLIDVLEAIVRADEALGAIEGDVGSGDLLRAAQQLAAFDLPTRHPCGDEGHEQLAALELRHDQVSASLQTRVLELMSAMVQIDDSDSLIVTKELVGLCCGTLFDVPLRLRDVIEAAHLSMAEEKVTRLVTQVISPFVDRVLGGNEPACFDLEVHGRGATATLSVSSQQGRAAPEETSLVDAALTAGRISVVHRATKLVGFLVDHVAAAGDDAHALELLRPLVRAHVIMSVRAAIVTPPSITTESMYAFCDSLKDACAACDAALARAAAAGDESRTLSATLGDAATHFAAERARLALSAAKALILSDWHNSVEIEDRSVIDDLEASLGRRDDAPPPPPGAAGPAAAPVATWHVSVLAQAVAAHARAVLVEARGAPAACALELYQAVRHVFELFRALIPLNHANTIRNVPRMAELFRNDCLFLSRAAILFSHEFCAEIAARQPEGSAPLVTLVDQVIPLRNLANAPLANA